MSASNLWAIDAHAHFGEYLNASSERQQAFASGDLGQVAERARQARTCLTFVSPLEALMPRGRAQPVQGNQRAAALVPDVPGIRQWVVVDPLTPETFAQAEVLLQQPHCIGIKIHPEEHGYAIAAKGRELFRFAAERRSVVLAHSGDRTSLPEDFVPFADEFGQVTLILAHLGHGWDGDLTHQVRAIRQCRHGNIYTDTSSAKSLTPGLIEWAVAALGAERVLYGTDSPLYFAPMQRARIDHAAISAEAKRLILRDNAIRLFHLESAIGEDKR
ncbi:MAG: amidohydrolase [Lentisphaerae bacterium]|nr:amidohydrolase [Lentisphaerota bacterium]